MIAIQYPLEHKVANYTWNPYTIQFQSPDGIFFCHIYAISRDHAQLQLDALKSTGVILGKAPKE
jgi:hypothetical protein